LLEVGETIQDGDEFYFIEPKLWTAVTPSLCGKQVDKLQVPFRRRIPNPWRSIKDAPTDHYNMPSRRHTDGKHYILLSDLPDPPVEEPDEFMVWWKQNCIGAQGETYYREVARSAWEAARKAEDEKKGCL